MNRLCWLCRQRESEGERETHRERQREIEERERREKEKREKARRGKEHKQHCKPYTLNLKVMYQPLRKPRMLK